ncbi:MAG TPA: UDP-N-acetylmuramoyl-tripeptide--D-alanyl-D-alanine ligase [Chitinophagaceae bacterium]|nr:UDP-N-acetylmuramoyl-tripeptide--D-alanyl-D-alanine ligase [Chitinophagaceae bacterium]
MNIEELYQLYLQHPSVATDTRKLKEGDLFFALRGPNFNGNEFAEKALASGAAYAVIDDERYSVAGKTIVVDDALQTLQLLAKHHRQQFTIPFIAITGSNGKTTTKELVHAVLSSTFQTYTTEGNLNNHIGVPLTILKIANNAEMAVIEMGANHQQEIASYCLVALPTHGLITNCGKAHLEGFGGVDGVRKGKGELFQFLRQYNGGAFVMWDYDYLRDMSKGIQTVVSYGTQDAQIEGHAVKSDPFVEVEFTKGFTGTIKTNMVGDYNTPNILAAVAVGKFFKVDEEKIRKAIENYRPSNSRSQLIEKGTNKIILDAYNANPSSMKLAIENLGRSGEKNKVLILGAMAELGSESFAEHTAIVEEIEQYSWEHVLLVGNEFEKTEHPFIQLNSAEEAGKWLAKQQLENTYILVKGSRSMQMERSIEHL